MRVRAALGLNHDGAAARERIGEEADKVIAQLFVRKGNRAGPGRVGPVKEVCDGR